jgi:hypothetical protein
MNKRIKTIVLGLVAATAAATASAAPILWDIGASANVNNELATVADFVAAGVVESLNGATVAHVDGAQYMTNGNIVVSMSSPPGGIHAATGYSGAGSSIIKDYAYVKNGSTYTNTISGLSSELDPDTTYSLYLWGKGDAANQYATFTYNEEAITISQADPKTTDADEFYAKFTFTTGSTVEDTLEFLWDVNVTYRSFNGFAIVAAAGDELSLGITPAYGATYVTNQPTIAVTVTNGSAMVDTSSFFMELAGDGATNDVSSSVVVATPQTSVTTFSYTPDVPLEYETEYAVSYSVAAIGGETNSYITTFTTAPALHSGTIPADGVGYVAVDAEVAVVFTNVAVSLSSTYVSCEMLVNSNDVTSDVFISYPTNGVMKFEYVHGGLEYGQDYDVELVVFRSDGYTNTVAFSFSSALDPALYLIAPGILNGGFELVNGALGDTSQVSDWTAIDDWSDLTGAGAKTEYNDYPTEGSRLLVTGNGSETYNITPTTINDGDIFEFMWTVPGRANGVSVGLAYSNDTEMVIVSNSLVYTSGSVSEFSGSYLFDADTDPDAIGRQVGLVIVDDNSGSGSVYVDELRLYYGNVAVQSFSPAADASGVAKTAPIEVVLAEAASQIDASSIVLTLDGVNVTTNALINDTDSGVTITYTPAIPLSVGKHFVSIAASGDPEGVVSKSWSFVVDPENAYLISPDVLNGSFELVGGVEQGAGTVSDWASIDAWGDDSGSGAKIEGNALATDGTMIYVSGTTSETYYITTTIINDGDTFDYSFIIVGRSYGLSVGLAYMDGTDVVTVSNSLQYVNGGTTPFSVNGTYTFNSSTEPEAIGKPVGIIFIDDGAGSGAVQIDEVRFYPGESPTLVPIIQSFDVDGATVTLSWASSENLGSYSIERKTALAGGAWSTVVSNLPPGTYTNVIPASGSVEFYRVKGE